MSGTDPYSDPTTGVLYNQLGLQTWDKLEIAERDLTRVRGVQLLVNPPKATYDLDHLCSIHWQLFFDIYNWAGEIRTWI